ncbi:MAG TPA: aromatic ring-hydroxylating dioxygenase subunit alpha [Chloroflexota bacterium]|nr:aromatic ring-hydroxylating dioxygenase subunit alpha [Chloroflexota bacterium]
MATLITEVSGNGNGNKPAAVQPAADPRFSIPELGLREYWYPAALESEVSWRKPLLVKMLGQDLCLFRGKSGRVVALANACPHRGAMLSEGHCDFKGTLTCFYHGFTFDEQGRCVAALGEGPKSPMPDKVQARIYPTVSHKGVVFAWMGDGEAAPLEESIPEEFFDQQALVFHWVTHWPCNWRGAVENYADSHVRYVHRNSVLMLMKPILGPFPVGRPRRINQHRLMAAGNPGEGKDRRNGDQPYQDYYPELGAKWPHHRWRLAWTWFFVWAYRRKMQRITPYQLSDEWGPGQHLPSIVRLNYQTHVYTRWVVPVEKNLTRLFYFHAAKRATKLGRLHERLHWTLFHNWAMNKNFSEQDSKGAIRSYWEEPENLAPTDAQTIAWRKMALEARGMPAAEPSSLE